MPNIIGKHQCKFITINVSIKCTCEYSTIRYPLIKNLYKLKRMWYFYILEKSDDILL